MKLQGKWWDGRRFVSAIVEVKVVRIRGSEGAAAVGRLI